MPQTRLSFLIRATYGTLPSPAQRVNTAPVNHILSITALDQGHYRFSTTNEKPTSQQMQVVHSGQSVHATQNCPEQDRTPVLTPGKHWSMSADVSKQLHFPTILAITTLRLDKVEVGYCSFVSLSTNHLLRDVGFTSAKAKRVLKEAEKGSVWLWLKRIYKM